jgi:hypothetical protein
MKIEPAKPGEFSRIIDLFRQYNFALKEERWFNWKHLHNPNGKTLVFKLLEDDRLDGTISVIPQIFYKGSKKFLALQAVDGLLGKSLRGRGLYTDVMAFIVGLKLEEVDTPSFRLGFASLPGPIKSLENAGWKKFSHFRIYKAILDTRPFLSFTGGKMLSVILQPVISIYLTWLCRGHRNVEVKKIDRFVEDMNRFQPMNRIVGDRSSEFLNWRVIDNPRDTLHAFGFYENGKLVGYAVCKELHDLWEVLEFRTSLPGPQVIASLIKYISKRKLTCALDFWLMEGHEQFHNLPTGLLNRGTNGAMFVNGHQEIGLSDENINWAASFLDSDW